MVIVTVLPSLPRYGFGFIEYCFAFLFGLAPSLVREARANRLARSEGQSTGGFRFPRGRAARPPTPRLRGNRRSYQQVTPLRKRSLGPATIGFIPEHEIDPQS